MDEVALAEELARSSRLAASICISPCPIVRLLRIWFCGTWNTWGLLGCGVPFACIREKGGIGIIVDDFVLSRSSRCCAGVEESYEDNGRIEEKGEKWRNEPARHGRYPQGRLRLHGVNI